MIERVKLKIVTGLVALGKTRVIANSKPPVIRYRWPSYGGPSKKKFRKRKGQFTFRFDLAFILLWFNFAIVPLADWSEAFVTCFCF